MRNNLIKTFGAVWLIVATVLTLPSCNQNEPSSLIETGEYKDLMEEANRPVSEDDTKVSGEEISKIELKEYVASLPNAYGTELVQVNADVDIPQTDKFSVYSVKQKEFTQEFADKVRNELFGDAKIYNGKAVDALEDIAYYNSSISETGSNTLKDVFRGELNEILNGFGVKDDRISLTSFATDGKIKTVAELYGSNPFYEHENILYPDGDFLSITTDGSNGKYDYLQVRNSIRYSNRFEYISNKLVPLDGQNDYIDSETFEKYFGDLDKILADDDNLSLPDGMQDSVVNGGKRAYLQIPGETCELSEKEAIEKAETFLVNIGLDAFKCYEINKTKSKIFGAKNVTVYRIAYEMTFLRNINGVFLTQSSGDKNNLAITGPDGGGNGKKHWYGEKITICVNDDGIVHFIYKSPLEITETVIDDVKIKNFDEIKTIFEDFVTSRKVGNSYNIDNVRLSYSRISEGTTNYETGLIVPMWDFRSSSSSYSYYAINAVDGTIIEPKYGYY